MIAFDRKFGEEVSIHGVANSSWDLTWLDSQPLRFRVMENEDIVEAAVDKAVADDAVVEEELLIEEISIDGMCGVY